MAILLSYKNARGETAILDDTERRFIWENYGRTGTEAPTLEYTEVTYADGSTEIIAINMQPRECTFMFTVPMDKRKPALREKFEALKQQLIQTGAREGDWGQLMIRRPDGRELFPEPHCRDAMPAQPAHRYPYCRVSSRGCRRGEAQDRAC